MPVPEERQLLLERAARGEHSVRPPEPQALCFYRIGSEAIKKLVDDRLEPTLRSLRTKLLAEPFAMLPGDPHRFCAARREWIHPRVPDTRFAEGLQVALDRFKV